jgi:hypothetical protein
MAKLPTVTAASPATTASIFTQLSSTATKTYKVTTGIELFNSPASVNIMLYGPTGSGKTELIAKLLLAGLKVLVIDTDFGGNGLNTVRNYFYNHPDERGKLLNLLIVPLDSKGLQRFVRNPTEAVPNIYTFNPDVLFWDGGTAWQQCELENEIMGDDPFRDEADWKSWKSAANGTIFTLMHFLKLHDLQNGKLWSKVVTFVNDSKGEYEKDSTDGKRILIPNTVEDGPLLHTGARKVSQLGFDVILRTDKKQVGKDDVYTYISRGAKLLGKQRGYNLPDVINANDNLWEKYFAERLKGAIEE